MNAIVQLAASQICGRPARGAVAPNSFKDHDDSLRQVFGFGLGELAISDIRIGETPASDIRVGLAGSTKLKNRETMDVVVRAGNALVEGGKLGVVRVDKDDPSRADHARQHSPTQPAHCLGCWGTVRPGA